ncbi:hypothetical protein GCM10011375_00220 [Hymenobacter qilianensis]|uniref:HTTM domain-containing protein n=2 Tax=Hymenobacter qilianensis TaxID=1385715 RepID=A0A7H0GRT5_9BACT|nr:HTTM domain-containing protein [Hymenobacter qilianensis]QNP51001.1 HTTM domain-containing protein [Hymenobacter qilianensis]GGF48701.1 hypothetical protein GCM10011375_00220 [Hymenobacter qilianensis]
MTRVLDFLRRPFILDLRALALLRMATAAVVLTDLAIRSTDLEAHYANMGVLPLHVLYERNWNAYQVSLHNISGLWQIQALLFLIAAGFAIMLLLGYKTRLATVVSWLLLVSLQNRNPIIGQGGDDLLRMLLFWGIFLPWGRMYSADAGRTEPKPASYSYFSAATVAYVVQLALVYWCTALLKNAPEWTTEGTAIYYALSLDQVLMPGGRILYQFPEVMRFLTFAVYYTELLLPFVLFIPVGVPFWRVLFVVVMYGFHLGISLTLFVGLFFLINMASVLGLLPTPAMDWIDRHVRTRTQRLQPHLARLNSWRSPVRVNVESSLNLPPKTIRLLHGLRNAVVTLLLAYICWWNLDSIAKPSLTMSEPLRWFGYLFRIDQHWGMFAPAVFKDDGWYILDATTRKGQHIDLNRQGKPVTLAKPKSVVSLFKNDRWRKYSENYLFVSNAYLRPYYCNYLLRVWNEDAGNAPVQRLDVIYMKEVSQPNYRVVKPTREVLCSCETALPAK